MINHAKAVSSEVFILRVLLSFIIGGLYIAAMSRLSERFGSKLGGLLIALPSVTLVGLGFIVWSQGSSALSEATLIMPATIAASTIFLMFFSLLYRFGLAAAYAIALSIWFGLNLPIVIYKLPGLEWAILIAVVLFAVSITFFHRQPHRTLPPFKLSRQAFIFRALLAGSFVAIAVICSKLFGPVWGGLFASFPAAFSATVLIFASTYGPEFTASLSRTMVNGALANVIFVTSIHLLVHSVGPAMSIILAYLICLVFALFSYRYIIPRI